MCFSVTASFTTAILLVPAGVYCMKKAVRLPKSYWLVGALPLLFGVQQAFEGGVWITINSNNADAIRMAALGFMFFSHFFWLFWIPMTGYAIENHAIRKKLFFGFAIFGGLYGASMYFPLFIYEDWLTVALLKHSISYEAMLIYDGYIPRIVVRGIYALVVSVPLLLSSDHYLRIFGVIIATSVVLATVFYGYAFISIWCYFAAVLSLYIIYMMGRIDSSNTD